MHVVQPERLVPITAISAIFWRLWAVARREKSSAGWVTLVMRSIAVYLGGCGITAWVRAQLSPIPPPPAIGGSDRQRLKEAPHKVSNWRDLGGLAVVGRGSAATTRMGEIFRSGQLNRMAKNKPISTGKYTRRQIATVVDLRSAQETKSAPNKCPGALKVPIRLDTIEHGTQTKAPAGLDEGYIKPILFNPAYLFETIRFDTAPAIITMMTFTQPGFCDNAVPRFFAKCADPAARPIVVHCREGKDRTGTMCALLQLALGVSEADVIRDFLLSNALTVERVEKRRVAISFLWLAQSTITSAIQAVKVRHGGFTDEYWATMGVTSDVLSTLRKELVVSAEN